MENSISLFQLQVFPHLHTHLHYIKIFIAPNSLCFQGII